MKSRWNFIWHFKSQDGIQKTTYFSSNKDLAALEKSYINKKALSNYVKDEQLKAARLVERIKALTKEVTIKGYNKRY
ncbi:hypothetical protein [Spiroplasma clarkii]|uniref:hypothetical protein n=1 Tax=Spiroplasma clarkii TaxID=2139 RepID=UPI0011BA5EDB|nr:hypothetical protein [Spiroplasma clarkii]